MSAHAHVATLSAGTSPSSSSWHVIRNKGLAADRPLRSRVAPRRPRPLTGSAHAIHVKAGSNQNDSSNDAGLAGVSRRGLLSAALVAAPAVLLMAPASAPPAASAAPSEGAPLSSSAKVAVDKALAAAVPKNKAPAVLRVVFHDAGTFDVTAGDGGANGSVKYELSRPENKGLKRGLNCVMDAMKRIEGTAAQGEVSLADMIMLAGAYAVRVTGGPVIDVPVGRVDATEADPNGRMPEETLQVEALKANFAEKGFSVAEFVALCGSHAIGNKGFGDPLTFDNVYYTMLLQKPWDDPSVEMREMIGLPSDRVLATDAECLPLIERYAADEELFFGDFSAAFLKLSVAGAKWR